MNYKPLTVYEELRDSYIIDGISRKKAEIYARRDCNNSEDKEKFKKFHNILKKELEDAALLEGDFGFVRKQKFLNFISNIFGGEVLSDVASGLFSILFILFLKILFFVADSVIFCILWNFIIINIWNFCFSFILELSTLTFIQALLITLVLKFVKAFIRFFN